MNLMNEETVQQTPTYAAYKDKSLDELEAMLDNYKKGNPVDDLSAAEPKRNPAPMPPAAAKRQEASKPSSQRRVSRYNSQSRPQAKENNKVLPPITKNDQKAQPLGIRRQNSMNRASQQDAPKDVRKGYGKVPKYLQRFKSEKEEQKIQKDI